MKLAKREEKFFELLVKSRRVVEITGKKRTQAWLSGDYLGRVMLRPGEPLALNEGRMVTLD